MEEATVRIDLGTPLKLLRRIGFYYANHIDPFDGGLVLPASGLSYPSDSTE